jgi:hypothetical protein
MFNSLFHSLGRYPSVLPPSIDNIRPNEKISFERFFCSLSLVGQAEQVLKQSREDLQKQLNSSGGKGVVVAEEAVVMTAQ